MHPLKLAEVFLNSRPESDDPNCARVILRNPGRDLRRVPWHSFLFVGVSCSSAKRRLAKHVDCVSLTFFGSAANLSVFTTCTRYRNFVLARQCVNCSNSRRGSVAGRTEGCRFGTVSPATRQGCAALLRTNPRIRTRAYLSAPRSTAERTLDCAKARQQFRRTGIIFGHAFIVHRIRSWWNRRADRRRIIFGLGRKIYFLFARSARLDQMSIDAERLAP